MYTEHTDIEKSNPNANQGDLVSGTFIDNITSMFPAMPSENDIRHALKPGEVGFIEDELDGVVSSKQELLLLAVLVGIVFVLRQ